MKVAIYARVSTRKGEEKQTTENQLRELKAYCERQGWTDYQVFEDHISGKKSSRPGLDSLMQNASLRKIDVVIVWKLDRLARSMQDFVKMALDLDYWGVRFICTSQGIDTDKKNPASRFLMHVLAAMAEFESTLIAERVRSGIARVRSEGQTWGRPKRVYDRAKARQMREDGASWAQISKAVGVPVSTIRNELAKNPSPKAIAETLITGTLSSAGIPLSKIY